MTNRAFTLIELLIVIGIIAVLSAIVIASVNSARDRARTTAIKSEVIQLHALAMQHYFEKGTFTTFATYGWVKGDGQDGTSATACTSKINANALNREKAIELCNSIASKLPTNLDTGSAANKIIMGCNSATYCDAIHQWSLMVKLQDNMYQTGANAGKYFCVGSSGQKSEGVYTLAAPGCVRNP